MKKIFTGLIITALVLWTQPVNTAMTGGSYNIPVDSLIMSEGDLIIGGNYSLEGAVEGISADDTKSGGVYSLIGGFAGATGSGSLTVSFNKSSISLDFGSSPVSIVASDSLILTVTADSITGYGATISESGNLASGANDINDVSDGSVTAGTEEYGIRTSSGDGLLVSDTAINGSVVVASSYVPVSNSQTAVVFSAAASQNTKAGAYSHTVTFTITANP
ncbi:MAG: hypothetical protein WC862_00265 [Patescibacteria group bacterium]